MPSGKDQYYQRGQFWLDYVRGAGGKPASSRFYIWWYSTDDARLQRKSTGTSDLRLASDALDDHYLATHRPTDADQARYTVSECMTDYWREHASKLPSADAVSARLKLMSRYIDHAVETRRIRDPFLPAEVDDRFLDDFRKWALVDPIVARRKVDGRWVDGKKRSRKASTVEESVIALKAAINYAYHARRIRHVPPLRHKTRDQVTSERSYRLSLDGLAELIDYSCTGAGRYGGHGDRLIPLRRYLVGAICTLARPDAILDMSVAGERMQWLRQERRFNLNPEGRIQTRKMRPILPIVDLLNDWLLATDQWFVCKHFVAYDAELDEDVMQQIRVASIRSGWDGAKSRLGIPDGWGPKLIRHSMSSILANRRVNLIELEVALGHRVMKKTTSKYAHLDPDYLRSIADGIEDVVADLTKKVGSGLQPATERVRKAD